MQKHPRQKSYFPQRVTDSVETSRIFQITYYMSFFPAVYQIFFDICAGKDVLQFPELPIETLAPTWQDERIYDP